MSLLDPQRQEDGEQVLAEDRQQGQGGLHKRIGLWPEVLWGDRCGGGESKLKTMNIFVSGSDISSGLALRDGCDCEPGITKGCN